MVWTAPRTWVAAEVVTNTLMNTHVRDNLNETAPSKAAAKGDIFAATAANAIAAVTVGANNTVVMADSAQSAGVKFADLEDGANLDGDHLDIDFTPTNYTPSTAPAEAADVDDLAAHLQGIDDELGNLSAQGVSRHYALFATTTASLINSFNVDSVTDNGTGDFTVTITTDYSNANYSCWATPQQDTSAYICQTENTGKAAGSYVVLMFDDAGTAAEPGRVATGGFGDQ